MQNLWPLILLVVSRIFAQVNCLIIHFFVINNTRPLIKLYFYNFCHIWDIFINGRLGRLKFFAVFNSKLKGIWAFPYISSLKSSYMVFLEAFQGAHKIPIFLEKFIVYFMFHCQNSKRAPNTFYSSILIRIC